MGGLAHGIFVERPVEPPVESQRLLKITDRFRRIVARSTIKKVSPQQHQALCFRVGCSAAHSIGNVGDRFLAYLFTIFFSL